MNIVQITPGAGRMFCGGCLHDNALVTALRTLGHDTLMLPLYLPPTLDEPDQSAGLPVFYGGISVYLEQKFPVLRHMPGWLRHLLAKRPILKWAADRAAKTRADEVGELTISMLRGEEGNQAQELEELVTWLKEHHRPQVVCLSNALLSGLARRISQALQAPVCCLLQGEDTFLDGLPVSHRELAWKTLAARAADVACFIAPSRYYAQLMAQRLSLPPDRLRVVPNGINLDGYGAASGAPQARSVGAPVLGYFTRMCPEKGLGGLVEAYLLLKQMPGLENVRLKIGGSCGPADEPFVQQQRDKLSAAGWAGDVEFHPNVDHAGKVSFFNSIHVLSVPALYGEAFGLYLIEALAAGVPVVQPRHAAFPEIVEATGGGVLCEPGPPPALAEAIAALLRDPARAQALGRRGQEAVRAHFNARRMAENMAQVFESVGANFGG